MSMEANIRLSQLREKSESMAKDDGLWFVAQTAAEAYLQHELRILCALIDAPLYPSPVA